MKKTLTDIDGALNRTTKVPSKPSPPLNDKNADIAIWFTQETRWITRYGK